MLKLAVFCLMATSAFAFYYPRPEVKVIKVVEKEPEPAPAPQPYSFQYDVTDDDGNNQARSESGDEHGNMKGTYSILSADGLSRNVEYTADGDGFRAKIITNEPGTDGQNPANVDMTVKEVKVVKVVKPEPIKYKIIRVPIHGY